MKIAIVKYNAGNIASVANALSRLGAEHVVTDDAEELAGADKVIFPGVGEASSALAYLRGRGLDRVIKELKQPVLAICLGMQLLGEFSEENNTECLGLIPFTTRRFASDDALKVPHMGWNNISGLSSPLFAGVPEESRVYFVHSFYVPKSEFTTATTGYGLELSAAVADGNFHAVQFHPEKSGKIGARILGNFLNI
jgi:glutamine amidotransferase